jgi:4-amino-4-deoxychorismate lyase
VSQESAFWLDGTSIKALPLPDRSVDFGDGVFETLLLHRGHPLFLDMHFTRLGRGLKALAMPDCRPAAQRQVEQVLSTLNTASPWAVMRLSVIRAPGPRGYAPAQHQHPRILICVTPMERDCTKMSPAATLTVATIRLAAQPALAQIKHMNRLEQVLAAQQAQAEQVDECFLLDQAEQLVSVIAGNIFLVRAGELLTPLLVDCGVAGTRRRMIIEKWAPAIGLQVREARLTLPDLQSSEEVFYSNSLQTVRPVGRLGDRYWDNHDVCDALFRRYLEDLS